MKSSMYVEAISGYFVVLARNCLASTLDYIVMQMRKTNCENGYFKKSSESGRKSSQNRQKRRHQYVYVIKRTLHVSSKI